VEHEGVTSEVCGNVLYVFLSGKSSYQSSSCGKSLLFCRK
jgi:hypothetical protein